MFRYKRRHLEEKHDQLDRWLVSYADYMTLMFALFVVLYSLALVKKEQLIELRNTFSELFQPLIVKQEPAPKPAVAASPEEPDNAASTVSPAPANLADEQDMSQVTEEGQQGDERVRGTSLGELRKQLAGVLATELNKGDVELQEKHGWLIIRLSSGLLFPSGSASPRPVLAELIAELAPPLRTGSNYIRVRGYTDDQPIHTELFASNWQLSAARANAVLEALLAQGIQVPRLAIEAYGPNHPIASNSDEQGRTRNRRVDIAISEWAFAPVVNDSGSRDSTTDAASKTNNKSEQAGKPLPDYPHMKTITLPNGNIRITTRRESAEEQQP